MTVSIFLLVFALSAEAPPAQVRADLDGQGDVEIATAAANGAKVRLQVWNERGRLLAEAAIPEPGGEPRVTLTAGSLGSAGMLLEAVAGAPGGTCRSLWRYRDGSLRQIPLLGPEGPAPDCDSGWTSRWEKPAEDVPAEYVRERSRRRPNGLQHEVEAFRWGGFRLELDPERSRSEINGVEIPGWRKVTLYSPLALERLAARFDLSPFQTQPRLEFLADRAQGLFELRTAADSRLLRFGNSEVSLTVVKAPPGVDVLLIPKGGSPPSLGIVLHGPNALTRVPVLCKPAGAALAQCATAGPGETFRRVGARMNAG